MSFVAARDSTAFIKALRDAGVIPDNCHRVVIDCEATKVITIYYETYADERINDKQVIDAVFELGLKIKMSEEARKTMVPADDAFERIKKAID
jgi:hypothetical protein